VPRVRRLPSLDDDLASVAPPRGLLAGTAYSVKATLAQRELIGLLVARELKARYKDSALGFLWSLLRPLALLLIYYIAIGRFLGAERLIPEFAIFVFTGLTAWGLFSEIISGSTTSIINNSGLVKKVYLPREIFPIATIGSAVFNFVVQLGILLLATLVLGQFPLSLDLLYLPLALATLLLYALALALILSAVTVYLRDIQHLVEVLILVLFWASPIVYSFEFVHTALGGGILEQIYLANPMTTVLLGFQKALWAAGPDTAFPPDLGLRLGILLAVSAVFVWVGQRVFARLEGNFAQEL
jgi:ABC-2 type transport system permease protein